MNNFYCEQVIKREKKSVAEQLMFWNRVIEYEYFIGDGELIIDAIYNRSRRKNKLTIELSSVQMIAQLDQEELSCTSSSQDYDFTSGNCKNNIYVLQFSKKEKAVKVFIEPNEEVLKVLKWYKKA